MKYFALASLALFSLTSWNRSAAVPDRKPLQEDDGRTVTYLFTARVKTNGGVLPFKPGELIQGRFTYDLDAKPRSTAFPRYHLESPRNAVSFQLGDLRFAGAGRVMFGVFGPTDYEGFGIAAPDLQLPKGWEMNHTERSQSYSLTFQNSPSKGVMAATGVPERLALRDFVTTRELRLDFFHGVRFPGGQTTKRSVVFATVESLERVHR